MALRAEPLTDDSLDEVVAFFRAANPFAQKAWGWDTGRFIDWRWGGNAAKEMAAPGWFSAHCTLYRTGAAIRAVALAESGGSDMCIITGRSDAMLVGDVLGDLLDQAAAEGRSLRFEAAASAAWLRTIFAAQGLVEAVNTGCEWEYDLEEQTGAIVVPADFEVGSLAVDGSDEVYAGIATCVQRAFGRERDQLPVLRSVSRSPFFRPELSVYARSADGRVAAYCRGTVDAGNGVCGIDPVATHPDFQRRGLGRAVVRACFQEQRRLGGRLSYIGSAPEPAPGTFLYRSLGPREVSVASTWSTTLDLGREPPGDTGG